MTAAGTLCVGSKAPAEVDENAASYGLAMSNLLRLHRRHLRD